MKSILLLKGMASQVREESSASQVRKKAVLLKGTVSAVPKVH
jgi:hypothetical protein